MVDPVNRRTFLCAAHLPTGCATTAGTAEPAVDPIVGEYDLLIEAAGTTFGGVLTITSDGGDYSGTLTSDMTDPTPVSGFIFSEDGVAFEAAELGFTFLVEIDGPGLAGTFDGPAHGWRSDRAPALEGQAQRPGRAPSATSQPPNGVAQPWPQATVKAVPRIHVVTCSWGTRPWVALYSSPSSTSG